MHSCELDMFGDRIGKNFASVRHGVEFDFLGPLDELADDYRMFFDTWAASFRKSSKSALL